MKIENTQGISNIVIKTKTHNFCPIGKDWYTCNLNIAIAPEKLIPDYIDVDKYIATVIDKKELIIEDVVAQIFEHIKETYHPINIHITASVDDATHSAVIVEKAGDGI